MKSIFPPCAILASAFFPLLAQKATAAVSLAGFAADNYNPSNPGAWSIASDTALQLANSDPTILFSPGNSLNNSYEGTMTVNTSTDDDFIGLVLGYTPGSLSTPGTSQYILIDWKQATQAGPGPSPVNGPRGLALSVVTGRPADAFSDLWGHTGTVAEIARGATLGSTGWAGNTTYTFRVDYTPTNILFYVNDVLQFDVDATDLPGAPSSLPQGRFGFYAVSQEFTQFTLTSIEPIPEPSALLLSAAATVSSLLRRRRSQLAD